MNFDKGSDIKKFSFYLCLGLAALLSPIVLWKLRLPNIGYTYSESYQIFELFGFCASAALILLAYVAIRRRRGAPLEAFVPIILFVLISAYYLILIVETSTKSWDYEFYENAAKAILQGENPYTGRYLYPPLTAQGMALAYRLWEWITGKLGWNSSPDDVWYLVFYFYQCLQFFLIQIALVLCYRFARKVNLKAVPASLLTAALFLFNNPLFRTLKFNQVNLYILVSILLAILLLERRPILSGLAVGLGGHIKLFPLILLLPWAYAKKIAAVAGTVICFLAVLWVQSNWGRDWSLWSQFVAFAVSPYKKVEFLVITYFRDNSLHSLIYNIFRTIAYVTGSDEPRFDLAQIVVGIGIVAVLIWFALRFRARERAYAFLTGNAKGKAPGSQESVFRLFGHSMEALALILIISPLVWEHLYILVIPIVIWTFAIRGLDKIWPIGIAAFLMFGIPTFDIFPLSYHRLAGLLMLLYYNSPSGFPPR